MTKYRREWEPVPWSHHPQVIKDTIRRAGFRPRAKRCYDNCGQFVMALSGTELAEQFSYCEGFVQSVIPVEHAWLLHQDRIIDLTLADARQLQYGAYVTLTVEQACRRIEEMRRYGPLVDNCVRIDALQQYVQEHGL